MSIGILDHAATVDGGDHPSATARYLAACETTIMAALEKGDKLTAAVIAKYAISVALTCISDFETNYRKTLLVKWYRYLWRVCQTDGNDHGALDALRLAKETITHLLREGVLS